MAILAVDADLTILTVLARLADVDVLGQLQIIRDLAIFILGFVEQDVLASIDILFCLFVLGTGWRAAFYGQSCMRSAGLIGFCIDIIVDFLQIAKVRCILQSIAGCCSNRGILTLCIFSTIKGTLDVRDLVAADIDIATSDGSRTITAKDNLSTGSLVAFSLLVADGRDALQIFGQLDFQLAICRAVDADITFRQVLAVRTADDIESVVQLLGNDLRCIFLCIIAGILHAVFHGSYLVFTGSIRVDDTGQARSIYAFFTFNTILAIRSSSSIIAILDRDIDSVGAILAIGASRACQADMADAVFTGNGDRIVAVRAGDADFTVRAICSLRTSDGYTIFARCAIFTIKTADRDAIGAVQADMAILAVDANLTIFTIFARLTDVDVLGQLQIIRDLAIFIRGFVEQDVLASIDAFILFIILTSCRAAFYSQCRMRCTGFISFCVDVIVDLLQITKVCCIFQIIAGCCSNRGGITVCIFGTIKGTLYIGDSCTILTSKSNLSFIGI